MHTKLTIGGIALSVGITGASLVVTALMRFGTRQGLGIVAATSVMVVAFYRAAVRPWRSKCGRRGPPPAPFESQAVRAGEPFG